MVAGSLALLILLLVAAAVGSLVGLLPVEKVDLPQISALEHYQPISSTEINDIHGVAVGSYSLERRSVVGYAGCFAEGACGVLAGAASSAGAGAAQPVIDALLRDGKITAPAAAAAREAPLGLRLQLPENPVAPWFVEQVREELDRRIGSRRVTARVGSQRLVLRPEDWAWTVFRDAGRFLRVGDVIYVHLTGDNGRELRGELAKETGAQAALPIWTQFMTAAVARHPHEAFPGQNPDSVAGPVLAAAGRPLTVQ